MSHSTPTSYPVDQLGCHITGSGPPLLMIHGNPATHTLWRPFFEALGEQWTIYAVDLPGFGVSPAPAGSDAYALPNLARIIHRFADLHGLERFDLMGHSFGGAVAVTVTDLHPERIRSLVLLAPLGDEPPAAARLASSGMVRGLGNALWKGSPRKLRRWVIRQFSRTSYGAAYNPQRAREVAAEIARIGGLESIHGVMAGTDYEEYRRALHRLGERRSLPVFLAGGEQDNVIPYEHFRRTCAAVPHAEVLVFPEGGHVLMWQYPRELLHALGEFYSRIGNIPVEG